jgi:hypothetical protein
MVMLFRNRSASSVALPLPLLLSNWTSEMAFSHSGLPVPAEVSVVVPLPVVMEKDQALPAPWVNDWVSAPPVAATPVSTGVGGWNGMLGA